MFLEFKEAVVRPEGATADEQQANMQAAGERIYAYLSDARSASHGVSPRRSDRRPDQAVSDGASSRPGDHDIPYLLVIAGLDPSRAPCRACSPGSPAPGRAPGGSTSLACCPEPSRSCSATNHPCRWVTVGHRGPRGCGTAVPGGSLVEVVWAAANVDATAFPAPLTVDFDRPRNAHVAFAAGPHRCLGSTSPGWSCASRSRSSTAGCPSTPSLPGNPWCTRTTVSGPPSGCRSAFRRPDGTSAGRRPSARTTASVLTRRGSYPATVRAGPRSISGMGRARQGGVALRSSWRSSADSSPLAHAPQGDRESLAGHQHQVVHRLVRVAASAEVHLRDRRQPVIAVHVEQRRHLDAVTDRHRGARRRFFTAVAHSPANGCTTSVSAGQYRLSNGLATSSVTRPPCRLGRPEPSSSSRS